VIFEVLAAVSVKITVLFDVTPCSLVDNYQVLEEAGGSVFLDLLTITIIIV
jgi:hypothetical protein